MLQDMVDAEKAAKTGKKVKKKKKKRKKKNCLLYTSDAADE